MGNVCVIYRQRNRRKQHLPYTIHDIPSVSLFDELGVPLISRPSVEELRELWQKCDENCDNFLQRDEFHTFLRSLHHKWGSGEFSPTEIRSSADKMRYSLLEASMARTSIGAFRHLYRVKGSKTSRNILNKENIEWDDLMIALWGPLVNGISSSIVLLFARHYKNAMTPHIVVTDGEKPTTRSIETVTKETWNSDASGGLSIELNDISKNLSPESSATLAKEILLLAGVSSKKRNRIVRKVKSSCKNFDDFVQKVGPAYAKATNSKKGIYNEVSEGDLPLNGIIDSFAPVRERSHCQILNCGEAVMTAMLYAIKGARTEIFMSWWEFCATLPGIRNAQLGSDAWKKESGSLLSILKEKADKEGCKIYILLYNCVNVVNGAAQSVEFTKKSLGGHRNIHVVDHPGLSVWQWSHHQKFVVVDRTIAILGGVDWTVGRWDNPDHPIFDVDSAVHPGLDIHKLGYKKSVSEWWDKPWQDIMDRKESTVRPWQDVGILVKGLPAKDVATNFIDRWEFIRRKYKLFFDSFNDSMPSLPHNISVPVGGTYEANDDVVNSLTTGGYPSDRSSQNCSCQIVRTLGDWSGGLKKPEISHYQAWIKAINSAREYIYIEQQFFIVNIGEGHAKNRVGEALLNRAIAAIDESRVFKIYVVIPEILDSTVCFYTRKSLVQDSSNNSKRLCLISRIALALKEARPGTYWYGRKVEEMMIVCTLSGVGKSASGRWDCSDIFPHSKALLVDDKVAVIGSANVNDRSFEGNHDSELGAIIWADPDEELTIGPIKDFRLRLWRQLLGLDKSGTEDSCILDPSSCTTFKLWMDRAKRNQTLLASVFSFTPRDSITSVSHHNRIKTSYKQMSPQEKGKSLNNPDQLEEFKGQIVIYPSKFLSDQTRTGLVTGLTKLMPILQEPFL